MPDSPPSSGPGVPGPLSIGATVRTALALYRADAARLWGAIALVVVPTQALVLGLRLISIPSGAVLRNAAVVVRAGQTGTFTGVSTVAAVLSALMLLVSIGAAYRIILGRYLDHPADLRTSFSFALDRAFGLVWVSILVAACVLVGFLLFILPGIYFIVALSVAVPVLMTEGGRGARALARSQELVAGAWFHVLGCLLVAAVLGGLGEGLLQLLLTSLTRALTPGSIPGFLLIGGALTSLVAVLLAPFSAAVSTVIYVDMLVRKHDPYLPQLLA
ncbi:MAG TPA: hypothetical protein VFN48_07270 [Solirubrobacteraceae bacterium]|nr:hypothetical protein [Solirubrobacteraceae bacterium]